MPGPKHEGPKRRPIVLAGFMILVILAAPGSSGGQPTPVTSELAVNSYTEGNQYFPVVAPWRDRGFVVVWNGTPDQDGDEVGIFGRLFNRNGARVGDEFQVNSSTSGNQAYAAVRSLPDGGFVVVWESDASPTDEGYGIVGQRFGSDGAATGGEFQVNTTTTMDQFYPAIGAGAFDGSFVVVWESNAGQAADQTEIFARRFDSAGQGVGEEFQVNSFTSAEQLLPSASAAPDGSFVVVWQSYGSVDGEGSAVEGQLFDSSGGRIGGEFQINTHTSFNQVAASVDRSPDGSFVVAWSAYRSIEEGYEVQARRFGSDGKGLGDEFRVNTQTASYQRAPTVEVRSDRSFLVLWSSAARNGFANEDIKGQLYDARGQPSGGEFQVNTTPSGAHFYPRATENDGRLFAAWHGRAGHDSDGTSVVGRIYELPPLPVPATPRPSLGILILTAFGMAGLLLRQRSGSRARRPGLRSS